ncbi:hypothetical protein EJB05_23243, partial [Eragrostis curvula]
MDYEVGDKVEVLVEIYGRRSWHPATVVVVLPDQERCIVEYDNEDGARDTVDWADIRRRPPASEVEDSDDDGDEERNPASGGDIFFKAGDRVELLRSHPDYGDAWYPATVEYLVDPESETYRVRRDSGPRRSPDEEEEEEEEHQELGMANFRPAVVESEFMPLDLRPGAQVEARCDGVWAIGAVLGAVGSSQYRVAIGEEVKVIKEVRDLRPRYKWDWENREWRVVASFPPKSASVKRPRSPVERASDDEHDYDYESTVTKRSMKQRQHLGGMPDGSEHALVSTMDNVSVLHFALKLSRSSVHLKKRCEEQWNPHSSLDATMMQLSTMGIRGSMSDQGLTATFNSSFQANQNEDEVATQLPFIKRLPLWSSFEEMEVFKKMPQQPHFGPLQKEEPLLREGIALGLMGTFANVAESISHSSIEDSYKLFQDKDSALSQMKRFGFNVDKLQKCLNKLIKMKSEYARRITEKDIVQAQKQSNEDSCSKVNSLRDKKVKMLVQLAQELQKLDEEKKAREEEFLELEEAESMVDKACQDIKEHGHHHALHPWEYSSGVMHATKRTLGQPMG